MKRLLLLRHAKSSWADPGAADRDRPLNARGRETAPRMGRLLVAEGLIPDCIVSSTARRAVTTAELVREEIDVDVPLETTDELYHATPREILDVVTRVPSDVAALLIVGHNPGFEELLAQLTGRDEVVPTAALAVVDLAIDDWSELAGSRAVSGSLRAMHRPRDLA